MSDANFWRRQYDQPIDKTVPTSFVSAVGFGGRLSQVSNTLSATKKSFHRLNEMRDPAELRKKRQTPPS